MLLIVHHVKINIIIIMILINAYQIANKDILK